MKSLRVLPYLVWAGWATFSRFGDWVQTVWLFALFRLTQDFTVVTGACCAVIHFEYFAVLVNTVDFLYETGRCKTRREKRRFRQKTNGNDAFYEVDDAIILKRSLAVEKCHVAFVFIF